MATAPAPQTLFQAIAFFSDYQNCRKAVEGIRWPDGIVKCPTCGSAKVTYLENARLYKCYGKHPRAKFSLKVGTIFEDSPLGLDKWLPALWLLTNCKNGISSYELARALGVTQKTAWFMLSRLRLALQDEDTGGMLSGTVEIDETYIGGKARNMHKAKRERVLAGNKGGHNGKMAVLGLLQRETGEGDHSKVRLRIVERVRRDHLMPHIEQNVAPLSTVYTDTLPSYDKMPEAFAHSFVNHAERYVEGQVHVNSLENFWALLKRAIYGTYVAVEPFHLFRYLDEQSFRFNNRKGNDAMRFALALKGILGRRLTYKALTGSELPQTC